MSAKTFSRAGANLPGARSNLKQLRRMRTPLALQLPPPAPRNHVALAMAARSATSAAGKHIRSQGAQRRADRVALQKALRQTHWND
jgi:K+-transporting ATPase c subunit